MQSRRWSIPQPEVEHVLPEYSNEIPSTNPSRTETTISSLPRTTPRVQVTPNVQRVPAIVKVAPRRAAEVKNIIRDIKAQNEKWGISVNEKTQLMVINNKQNNKAEKR